MFEFPVRATFTLYKALMASFYRNFQPGFVSLVLLLFVHTAGAQVAAPVSFPLNRENLSLSPFAVYTVCKNEISDFQTLSSYSFKPLPASNTARPVSVSNMVESAWVYFVLKNNFDVDTAIIVKTHFQARRNILYELRDQHLKEIGRSGSAMPFSQLSENDPRRMKIRLKANSTQHFFLRQQRHGLSSVLDTPELQTETQGIIEKYAADLNLRPQRNFMLLLLGFHFALFLFGAVKYYSGTNEKAYLWYGLYNLFTIIFVSTDGNLLILDSLLWTNLNQADYFLFFNIISILAFLQFQVEFLQLKSSKPNLVKVIKVFSLVLAGMALFTLVADQVRIFPAVFNLTRALSHGFIIFIVLFFIHLWNNRTGFNRYIFYGMLCWLVGITFYVPYIWLDLKQYLPPLIRGNFIMGVPTAIEVLFFLKALVYRDQEIEKQKIQFQQELIEQLKRNEVLQHSFARDLENQVKERTTELLEQRKVLEEQREEKLRTDFDQRFSESELKALRSQINPHFIFNVLNTIESFALENNSDAASDMIQKFSRLTRLVLENSQHQVVPIQSDLQALTLYIELEQIRYNGKFLTEVNVDEEVLEGNYLIPPMIIQPYVENAILHGLRNRPETGLLRIHVSRQDYYLTIIIEDNGIGRAKSAALKKDDVIKRTSIGMSVTQDRISMFNNLAHHIKAAVAIYDLDSGTRVELRFPAELV